MKPTELGNVHVLPNSLLGTPKGAVFSEGLEYVPVFCANCGCASGYAVTKETIKHAFYLCEARDGQSDCASKWQHLAGQLAVPDEVFFERVKQAQLEREGRELTALECLQALENPDHYLSKLAKDRPLFTAA